MSIEYRATFEPTVPPSLQSRLLAEVAANSAWTVVDTEGSTVRLRAADREPRSEWPEDIAVSVDGDRIDVRFDSATRQERTQFLAFLQKVLRSLGISADFEEM